LKKYDCMNCMMCYIDVFQRWKTVSRQFRSIIIIQHVFYNILYNMYNMHCIIYVIHYSYTGRRIDTPRYKFYPTSINHCVQSPSSYILLLLLLLSPIEYQYPHSFSVLNTKKKSFLYSIGQSIVAKSIII